MVYALRSFSRWLICLRRSFLPGVCVARVTGSAARFCARLLIGRRKNETKKQPLGEQSRSASRKPQRNLTLTKVSNSDQQLPTAQAIITLETSIFSLFQVH